MLLYKQSAVINKVRPYCFETAFKTFSVTISSDFKSFYISSLLHECKDDRSATDTFEQHILAELSLLNEGQQTAFTKPLFFKVVGQINLSAGVGAGSGAFFTAGSLATLLRNQQFSFHPLFQEHRRRVGVWSVGWLNHSLASSAQLLHAPTSSTHLFKCGSPQIWWKV